MNAPEKLAEVIQSAPDATLGYRIAHHPLWQHRNLVAYRAHRKRRLARLNAYLELSL